MSVGKNNKDYKKITINIIQSDFAIQIFSTNQVAAHFGLGCSRIPVPPRIEPCCFFLQGAGIPSTAQ